MRLRLTLLFLLWLPGLGRAGAPNPSFYLVNHSSQPISEAYASPVTASGWGRDRLGNTPIVPGGNAPVRLMADGSCVFDLRVVYADGMSEERRRINTCNVDDVVFGQVRATPPSNRQPQNDPSFRIVNRGRIEIAEVYATPAGAGNWGRDRLGEDTIEAGSYRIIQLPAGQCVYDLRIVFNDGDMMEKRHINLCTVTDLPIP